MQMYHAFINRICVKHKHVREKTFNFPLSIRLPLPLNSTEAKGEGGDQRGYGGALRAGPTQPDLGPDLPTSQHT